MVIDQHRFAGLAEDLVDAQLWEALLQDAPLWEALLQAPLEELLDLQGLGECLVGGLLPDEEEEEEDEEESGYGSVSEPAENEEDLEIIEVVMIDDGHFVLPENCPAPPAPAVEPVGLPQIPVPQQRAESPPQARREDVLSSQLSPAGPSSSSAPDFLPLTVSKRSREEDSDEDCEEDSKRPRLSSFQEDFDGPSSSSGFTRYYHHPHLLQDPESHTD